MARNGAADWEGEHVCSASFSDVDLLGNGKRVVYLDP